VAVTSGVTVAFATLGCPKNEVDTDRMRAALVAAGHFVTSDPEAADVAVVNTCSFIREATEESVSAVLEHVNEWLPGNPNRKLIVTGCMVSRYGSDLASELPEVAAFLPVAEECALLGVIERLTGASAGGVHGAPGLKRTAQGPSAYLQISDGCHRACTYCTIPSIRGPYRSTPLPELLAEARELVAGGAKELVLIGQDTTEWGRDLLGKETLADVVRAVGALPGLEWLRLMYVQPDGVTDELLAAIAETPSACRYLDIPLQHASMRVLRAMGRRGDAETFRILLARVREALPGVALRTTLIAGFPGETAADVRELQAFLRDVRFDYVGVFAYSPEEGTVAAKLPGQIPARTRRARAQRLRDLADTIGCQIAETRVGGELEVLVEGVDEDDGAIVGRWKGQAPEIDGLVLLDGGERGSTVCARIVDTIGYDLEGTVV
jgi:ribosomal protein S12 methylthiotransferase